MTKGEVFARWAPTDGPWTPWAKPTLFAGLDDAIEPVRLRSPPDWVISELLEPLREAHPYRRAGGVRDVTVIVDLAGDEGIVVGVALSQLGFRPVPLYNGLPGPRRRAVIDVSALRRALVDASRALAETAADGPPVFLLDARRSGDVDPIRENPFDNRWVCTAGDFPPAETLWTRGIRRAVLVQAGSSRPALDLEPTLLEWQRRGIALHAKASDARVAPAPWALERSSWLRRLLYVMARQTSTRHPDGSYGGFIKERRWASTGRAWRA